MIRPTAAVLLLAFALPAFAQTEPVKAMKELEGKYKLVSMTVAGKTVNRPEADRETFVIRENKFIAISPDGKKEDPLQMVVTPPAVDFTEPDRKGGPHMVGVYKLEGKTLTICIAESDKPGDRPKDVTVSGERYVTLVLEKQGEVKPDPKKGDPKKPEPKKVTPKK